MSIQVTCPTCGARLVYKGTTSKVKPCPKCQTPITFGAPAPTPVAGPAVEAAIDAEAVPEAKPQPKAAPVASPDAPVLPAAAPVKRSPVIWIALAGLAVAFGGLMVLFVTCAGIGLLLMHGGHRESLAEGSAGPSYSSKSGGYYDKSGAAADSSYAGYAPTDNSSYSSNADPYAAAATSPAESATANPNSQDSGSYGGGLFGGLFGGYSSPEDEAAEAAAQYEEARREAQRQINADYWANRAEQAASNGNDDEAARYRNYSENP